MKKIFTLFFALVATTSLWAQTFQVGDLYYNITSSVKPYTVEVTSGNYSGEVIIPETVTYNGTTYSVTRIGERAFQSCSITSVTIPASVISLEEYSFYQSQYINAVYLKSTTPPIINGGKIFITSHPTCYIPCGTLDAYQASKWANLMRKFVEEECKEEEDDNTNIITYTTSDGEIVTPSTSDVFGVNILSNEYKDGQGVITFDGPVTSIGFQAFRDCTSLTSITIPESVTSIGESAFGRCSSLTSVTIGSNVTSIGHIAFTGCSSLSSLTIPKSVTSIGNAVFSGCSSITSIVVESTNTIYDSRDNCNAIIETTTNTLIVGGQNTIIPNSVTSIGDRAFQGCSSLNSITIPNSVESIGDEAFCNCRSLSSITIGNSVTKIGLGAFAFCSSLTTIICEAINVPELAQQVFYNLPLASSTLYVPAESLEDYKLALQWKDFGTILPIEEDNPDVDIELQDTDMTIVFTNSEDNDSEIYRQTITIKVPTAPTIAGFTFLYWQPVAEPITNEITIQAIYEADTPTSTEVYTNPANPAQKLIRNGQVYILKDDKTYTIMGAEIQ